METINQSLGNLLRCFVGKNIRQRDQILAQVEFTFNRSTTQATTKSPSEIVYGSNPKHYLILFHKCQPPISVLKEHNDVLKFRNCTNKSEN
ncbi:hypothetical protein KFK09_021051 [Dendrobium nobile]|uniref:Uncharacterized protein n=1 Tax=Dendrobium nobile TaxID=94219 RepID=A0A8T3AP76_DENNO|nr:hypothetical protein KFK09_021051 [Dendrobium nobile]